MNPVDAFPPGPERRLAVASLIDTIGTGLNYAILPIFVIRHAGFSATQFGLALSIAGVFALAAGLAFGYLADRKGPRGVVVMAYTTQAVAAGILPVVHGFVPVLILLCVGVFAGEGGRASRYTVIARIGADPVRFRAKLQVVTNSGAAIGVGLGGVLASFGTQEIYASALLANAVSFALAAVIQRSMPFLAPVPKTENAVSGSAARSVYRDRPYIAVTVVSATLMIQHQVTVLALPLWILTEHKVPLWMISACMLTNTLIVVLFQVRVVRGLDTPGAAGRAWQRAGFCFLLSCILIPVAAVVPGWIAIGMVLFAVAVHGLGEIWHSGGIFQIALGLAPEHSMGKYQGFFNLGEGLSGSFAPVLVTTLCIGLGTWGWLLLGLLLVAPGLVAPRISRWAERSLVAKPQMTLAN